MSLGSVILRADGSAALGLGHIMRCRALAAALAEQAARVAFVARAFDSRVADLVRGAGFPLIEMPAGASAAQDAAFTSRCAAERGAQAIITDLCHYGALAERRELDAYHRALREGGFVVCIAGGRALDIPADILISPYVGAAGWAAPGAGNQARLLGPDYFIFRPEFARAARVPRGIADRADRIQVTIGGADDLRLTTRVLEAMRALGDPAPEVRVVIGPAFAPDLVREIASIASGGGGRIICLPHDSDLAALMLWADLIIMGDGLIKYEAAVTGTPGIMLSRPESDAAVNADFVSAGSLLDAGDGSHLSPGELAALIAALRDDRPRRTAMSRAGRALLDGQGVRRILQAIASEVLS